MIKKNSSKLGILIGFGLPAIIYGLGLLIGLIAGINIIYITPETSKIVNNSNLMLISVFANMLPFRYYMVNLKYEKTGKPILIATIVYAVVFFYFYL
ncbi:MAG: hypothetical protein R6U11_11570 [Bacteroidales bacterium]